MKKIFYVLVLFALSTTGFANCFPLYYSCGGGTTYCSQEGDTIEQINKDALEIDQFICG